MSTSELTQRLFELACQQDLQGVMERALDLILEISGAERGFVVTVGEKEELKIRAARNVDPAQVVGPAHQPSRSVIRRATELALPVRVGRALEESELGDRSSVQEGSLMSILALPLLEGESVTAVVCVDSTAPDAFDAALEARLVELSQPLGAALRGAFRVRRLQRQGRKLARHLRSGGNHGILGQSPALLAALETVRRVASSRAPVLVLGETGTGKELVARAIHRQSDRRDGPFVVVNCAALPEQLLEAELFGHTAGAFTGAHKAREGRFAAADGGVLFLDELGELGASAQARFLRVLESGEIQRLGDDRSQRVDVRVVAATHRDLKSQELGFRSDLFYRLAVVTITLPPLRTRLEDLDVLAEAFALEFGMQLGRRVEGMSGAARDALRRHAWPGNVRELRNAIYRATIFARGTLIEVGDLPVEVRSPATAPGNAPPPVSLPDTWDELTQLKSDLTRDLERCFAAQRLEAYQGNVSKAARESGLSRPAFYDLLERVGLSARDFRVSKQG